MIFDNNVGSLVNVFTAVGKLTGLVDEHGADYQD